MKRLRRGPEAQKAGKTSRSLEKGSKTPQKELERGHPRKAQKRREEVQKPRKGWEEAQKPRKAPGAQKGKRAKGSRWPGSSKNQSPKAKKIEMMGRPLGERISAGLEGTSCAGEP